MALIKNVRQKVKFRSRQNNFSRRGLVTDTRFRSAFRPKKKLCFCFDFLTKKIGQLDRSAGGLLTVGEPWLPTKTTTQGSLRAVGVPAPSSASTLLKVTLDNFKEGSFPQFINSSAVADSVGIPLTDDVAARELAEQANFRIRSLLQTAQKYSMHAKRRKMNAEDLDLALKAQGQEPLYGLCAAEHIPFRSVDTALF